MTMARLAVGTLIGSTSIIFAAVAGLAEASGDQLLYAALSLVCVTLAIGLMLDRQAAPHVRMSGAHIAKNRAR